MGLDKVRDVKYKRRDRSRCVSLTRCSLVLVPECPLCLLFSVPGTAH